MNSSLHRREFLRESLLSASLWLAATGCGHSHSTGSRLLGPRIAGPRDRAWLIRYLTQPIADSPRNRRYLRIIEEALPGTRRILDPDWLQRGGQGGNPRRQATVTGFLSFCYRTKGIRSYDDSQLLESLRMAYLEFADHITAEGRFDWPGITVNYDASPGAAWPEHAWTLESLLVGYVWIGDKLSRKERDTIEHALERATSWLFAHPNTELNNRGIVHCAVSQLCALFYDRPEFADLAQRNAAEVIRGVVFEDGECGEHSQAYAGGGPDSNYSYTSWAYVYLYRLLSGDAALDRRLLRACRWFAAYHTVSGWPTVVGASVRTRYVANSNFRDLLPAYERYARDEPFLSTLADRALDKLDRLKAGIGERLFRSGGGHIISPLIWALLEQGPQSRSPAFPNWYASFTEIYERPQVHYALIARQYQTGVVLRGRSKEPTTLRGDQHDVPIGGFPLRGMQVFAFGGEVPILLHTDTTNSSTRADGVDTATSDVEQGLHGWEVVLTRGPRAPSGLGHLCTLATRQKSLWTLYAYTPVSVVVVYCSAQTPITSRWVVNLAVAPVPILDSERNVLLFPGLRGRITYLTGDARLVPEEGALQTPSGAAACPTQVLEVTAQAPSAFGFSDESFAFDSFNSTTAELAFSDSTGRYTLTLEGMLLESGDFSRNVPFRLRANRRAS